MSVYSNLAHKRKTKKDAKARQKAEYLATLPKHPVKRILHRMHPKRVASYWFSKKGGMMILKVAGVGVLLAVLMVGGLFAYYRKDLDQIRPGELAKRVQTTVTKYYDRNDNLLWEDKGDGDYKLVVDSEEISKVMKDATIAIEDRDFYDHHGVSPTGLVRAVVNNASGGATQGGSTLTQQLVKQVFFADEAHKRGLDGVPRKIKELILSIEVERMYDKEQILSLYLNESSYGGRRNGVESAAQTYFGKDIHAKDLTLPQAALLAGIPNQPGLYDPYNIAGHEALIARQHRVLDNMSELGMITEAEAKEAKDYPILETIQPQANQYENIKAPHFVTMVRAELEAELGKATVGRGGLTVKTSLDIRVQEKLEEAMNDMFGCVNENPTAWSCVPTRSGFENGAATVEDNKTGQVIALLGSKNWETEGFGQDNAATAFIQPGSSIKPFVFAELLKDKGAEKMNYGSGSRDLTDTNFDAVYGAKLRNADGRFNGALTIRQSLAQSRNIPAVKAMHVSGVAETLQTIREMGNSQYCTQGNEVQAGLASAIGGCGTRQVDHVNAFATFARMGVYKPQTSILEVKNSTGATLKKWEDTQSKQVIDPQVAYIISDILSDPNARRPLFGSITTGLSYGDTGIKTATKSGTSDIDGKPRDLWITTYSPAVSMGVWLGNQQAIPLKSGNSTLPGPIVDKVMRFVHQEIYQPAGQWNPNDWFEKPEGLQTIRNELYPSWFNRNQLPVNSKMTFDKISKKKATDCTPSGARIEIEVQKTTDPSTKREVVIAPDGYDATKDDDLHKCDDAKPSVAGIAISSTGSSRTVVATVTKGRHDLSSVEFRVNGTTVNSQSVSGSGDVRAAIPANSGDTITVIVTDSAYYTAERSQEVGDGND